MSGGGQDIVLQISGNQIEHLLEIQQKTISLFVENHSAIKITFLYAKVQFRSSVFNNLKSQNCPNDDVTGIFA